jgi:hypothetical protein
MLPLAAEPRKTTRRATSSGVESRRLGTALATRSRVSSPKCSKVALGERETGIDDVDEDALAPQLPGEAARQAVEPGLGGPVIASARHALLGRPGRDQDDPARGVPVAHRRQRGADRREGALEVGAERAGPALDAHVLEAARILRRASRPLDGVGDEDVDAAPAVAGRRGHLVTRSIRPRSSGSASASPPAASKSAAAARADASPER